MEVGEGEEEAAEAEEEGVKEAAVEEVVRAVDVGESSEA